MLVIGASGYLGREVFRLSGEGTRGTHFRAGVPGTVPYDFFGDDPRSISNAQNPLSTVVFAAAVERLPYALPTFRDAVSRFVDRMERAKARVVYISSDAVFSGDKGGYSENDAPDAASQYGIHLRHFETLLAESLENHVIVRVSYLFGDTVGHEDRRLREARQAILAGKVLLRYGNVFKSPVHVTSAAQRVVELAKGNETGVVHIPGERLSIFDFYQRQCIGYTGATRFIQPQIAEQGDVEGFDTSLISLRK